MARQLNDWEQWFNSRISARRSQSAAWDTDTQKALSLKSLETANKKKKRRDVYEELKQQLAKDTVPEKRSEELYKFDRIMRPNGEDIENVSDEDMNARYAYYVNTRKKPSDFINMADKLAEVNRQAAEPHINLRATPTIGDPTNDAGYSPAIQAAREARGKIISDTINTERNKKPFLDLKNYNDDVASGLTGHVIESAARSAFPFVDKTTDTIFRAMAPDVSDAEFNQIKQNVAEDTANRLNTGNPKTEALLDLLGSIAGMTGGMKAMSPITSAPGKFLVNTGRISEGAGSLINMGTNWGAYQGLQSLGQGKSAKEAGIDALIGMGTAPVAKITGDLTGAGVSKVLGDSRFANIISNLIGTGVEGTAFTGIENIAKGEDFSGKDAAQNAGVMALMKLLGGELGRTPMSPQELYASISNTGGGRAVPATSSPIAPTPEPEVIPETMDMSAPFAGAPTRKKAVEVKPEPVIEPVVEPQVNPQAETKKQTAAGAEWNTVPVQSNGREAYRSADEWAKRNKAQQKPQKVMRKYRKNRPEPGLEQPVLQASNEAIQQAQARRTEEVSPKKVVAPTPEPVITEKSMPKAKPTDKPAIDKADDIEVGMKYTLNKVGDVTVTGTKPNIVVLKYPSGAETEMGINAFRKLRGEKVEKPVVEKVKPVEKKPTESKGKNLTAIYRDNKGNVQQMTYNDYSSKKAFAKELRQNGLKVLDVLTDDQIKEIQKLKSHDVVGSNLKEYVQQATFKHLQPEHIKSLTKEVKSEVTREHIKPSRENLPKSEQVYEPTQEEYDNAKWKTNQTAKQFNEKHNTFINSPEGKRELIAVMNDVKHFWEKKGRPYKVGKFNAGKESIAQLKLVETGHLEVSKIGDDYYIRPTQNKKANKVKPVKEEVKTPAEPKKPLAKSEPAKNKATNTKRQKLVKEIDVIKKELKELESSVNGVHKFDQKDKLANKLANKVSKLNNMEPNETDNRKVSKEIFRKKTANQQIDAAVKAGKPFHKSLLEATEREIPEGYKKGKEGMVTPKKATLDKIIKAGEEASKNFKERNKGKIKSGLDPQDVKDLTVIGTAKIAKLTKMGLSGAKHKSAWMKEMTAEFGVKVKAHLKKIYDEAMRHFARLSAYGLDDYSEIDASVRNDLKQRQYPAKPMKGREKTPAAMTKQEFFKELADFQKKVKANEKEVPLDDLEVWKAIDEGNWPEYLKLMGYDKEHIDNFGHLLYLTGHGAGFRLKSGAPEEIHKAWLEAAVDKNEPVSKQAMDAYKLTPEPGYLHNKDNGFYEKTMDSKLAVHGAALLKDPRFNDFKPWSKEMVHAFGEDVGEHLRTVWNIAKKIRYRYSRDYFIRTMTETEKYNIRQDLEQYRLVREKAGKKKVRKSGSGPHPAVDQLYELGKRSDWEKTKDAVAGAVKDVVENFSVDEVREHPDVAETLNQYNHVHDYSLAQAVKKVGRIFAGLRLSNRELEVLAKRVNWESWVEDYEKFGLNFPGGDTVTINQLKDQLANLVKYHWNTRLETALNRYQGLMKENAEELVDRKKMNWDTADKREHYAHRDVLFRFGEKFDSGRLKGAPSELKTQFRSYIKERNGSVKISNTDFLDVLTKLQFKFELDNMIDDIAEQALQRAQNHALEDFREAGVDAKALIKKMSSGKSRGEVINGKFYVPYQPSDGNTIFKGIGGSESAVYNEISNVLSKNPDIAKDAQAMKIVNALKEQVMIGSRKKTYVIEAGLAEKFNNMTKTRFDNIVDDGLRKFTSMWKLHATLSSGLRHDIYNLFLGDVFRLFDLGPVAGTKHLLKAGKLLIDAKRNNPEAAELLDELAKTGNLQLDLDSGGGKNPLLGNKELRRFVNPIKRGLYNSEAYLRFRAFREALPKLAAYQLNMERLAKGKKLRNPYKVDIEGLTPKEAVSRISRHTMIDYTRLSRAEKSMAMNLLVPFWPWYGSAFRSYAELTRKSIPRGMAKILIPTVAMSVWNNLVHPDVEKELPDYIREAPHITTGIKNSHGGYVVVSMPIPSAVVAQAIGANKVLDKAAKIYRGETNLKGAVAEEKKKWDKGGLTAVRAIPPLSTALDLIGPVKTVVEVASNKNSRTGLPIVSSKDKGTPREGQVKGSYFVKNMIPTSRWALPETYEPNPKYPKNNAQLGKPSTWLSGVLPFQYYYPEQERNRKVSNIVYDSYSTEVQNNEEYTFNKLMDKYESKPTSSVRKDLTDFIREVGPKRYYSLLKKRRLDKTTGQKTYETYKHLPIRKRRQVDEELQEEGLQDDFIKNRR